MGTAGGTLSAAGSGSSRGGVSTGAGGGLSGSRAGDECDITSLGTLRSPDPSIVPTLSVGSVLAVAITNINGVFVLRAATKDGRTVATIDCRDEQALIDCIGRGHVYEAHVTKIQGGAVAVTVRRSATP